MWLETGYTVKGPSCIGAFWPGKSHTAVSNPLWMFWVELTTPTIVWPPAQGIVEAVNGWMLYPAPAVCK